MCGGLFSKPKPPKPIEAAPPPAPESPKTLQLPDKGSASSESVTGSRKVSSTRKSLRIDPVNTSGGSGVKTPS